MEKRKNISTETWSYVLDTRDWPFRYVAVVRFTDKADLVPGEYLQTSCFTYRGAQRWCARMHKRAAEGLLPG